MDKIPKNTSDEKVQRDVKHEKDIERRPSDTSFAPSSTPTDRENEGHEPDIEALQTRSTNSAPWSIFTKRQKHFIVFMVAVAGFFSPLSANIYFPALNTLAADFGTSLSTMNLTLMTYMIFQGLAPTIFGDFADMA